MLKTYVRQLAMQFDALSVFLKSGNILSRLGETAEEFPGPGRKVKAFAGPGWKVKAFAGPGWEVKVFPRPGRRPERQVWLFVLVRGRQKIGLETTCWMRRALR
jgi:hypothetical protein